MSKPGMDWDPLRRMWVPIDYTQLSNEELEQRQKQAMILRAELEAQLKGLIPAAAAQSILNKSADEMVSILIKLAKKAPELLLGVI